MRQKEGFRLRTVCGENIIVAEGLKNIDFSKIISMNESSAYLWKKAEGQDFDAKDLAKWLEEEYEVSHEQALEDSRTLLLKWLNAGIVE